MTPLVVFAHETWFTDGRFPLDWGFATQAVTVALLAGALLITLGVRGVARVWPGTDLPSLARLAPWMPFAVRIHYAPGVGVARAAVRIARARPAEH